MPVGRRNVSAIVVANVGSLPHQYLAVAAVDYSGFTPLSTLAIYNVTVFSLNSTNIPVDRVIWAALCFTAGSVNSAPPNLRKIAF